MIKNTEPLTSYTNMKHVISFMLIVLFSTKAFSQNPSKGFELVEQKKFAEAEMTFRKSFKKMKDVIPAFYGLSLIFSNPNYEHQNLDSAYYFAMHAELIFNSLQKSDRERLLTKYQLSLSKIQALRYTIANEAFKKIDVSDIDLLKTYVKIYKNEKSAQKARDIINEYEAFKDYSDDKPIDYYQNLIQKYPNNPKTTLAWNKLYNYFTADGEFLSFEQFEMYYPQFPFDSLIVQDKELYKTGYRNHCFDFVVDANRSKCIEYISKAAPHHTAFRVFQNLVKPYIDKKQWNRVLEEIKRQAQYFGEDADFKSFSATISRNDVPSEPRNLGSPINTPDGNEYSPVISANGKHLYFCGMNRPDNLGNEDIFVSEKTQQGWSKPELIKQISSKTGNEAPETVSADETKIGIYYNGDIFSSEKTYTGWLPPKPIANINTPGWEGDAVYTTDGKAVIFSSEGWQKVGPQYPTKNRSDGFDIYISFRTKTGWSTPLNLGTEINTPWCDRYPYLHPDGKTLYFSSEGHGSLGASDVYKTTRLYDSSWVDWSKPVNLGKYINGTGDDNGYKISTDGTTAYFSVNKNNNIDIYETDLPGSMRPGNVAIISGIIKDENAKTLTAEIRVEDLETGLEVANFMSDPITGAYVVVLPMGRNYGFYVSRQFYYPTSENIDLQSKNEQLKISKDIKLVSIKNMLEKGISVTVNNVFFDTDKFDLRQESDLELKRLIQIMNENVTLKISIEGHTDNDGTEDHNQQLSLNRANAVKKYLVSQGIAMDRIETTGFGSLKPIKENTSVDNKQKNRRVEIRFKRNER